MHCDYCLKPSPGGPACEPCDLYLVRMDLGPIEEYRYARRLDAIASVQKEIRLAGGIKPWIAKRRQQHRERFPKTDEFLKASDHDVRSFTERLRLVGGPLVARP